MDISTTKTIKRRRFEVYPENGKKRTNCFITGVNFFNNRDLSDIKFRLSSFFMNNSSIPTFLPKFLATFPPASYLNDLQPSFISTYASTQFLPETCDYVFNVNTLTANTAAVFNFSPVYSTEVDSYPGVHSYSAFQQYTNPYFYVYDTSLFCEALESQISALINTVTAMPNGCKIVKTNTTYAIYILKTFIDANNDLQFSKSLMDLFPVKNVKSIYSSNLYTIIPNKTPVTVDGVQYYVAYTQYISDKWNSYDSIIFKTNLPVEKESVYDSNSFVAKGYDNLLLIFKIGAIPYNYFTSAFQADDNFCTLNNTNSGENMFINCYLRIRETNDLVPYTITEGEKFYIACDEIVTF